MNWNWFNKPLELLKLQTRYWLGAVLVLGILLFVSDSSAKMLGIYDLRVKYQPYLGISFIISLSIIFVRTVTNILEWGENKYNRAKSKKDSVKNFV
jgi:hypothetical protein